VDVHAVAMPAPNVNVAPRGAKPGPSKAGPKFVQLTMPAGELAGLKASLSGHRHVNEQTLGIGRRGFQYGEYSMR
jgi:hypothetical protein